MSVIEGVLARLKGVKQRGSSQWDARCPAHGDKKASLSISEGNEGRVLLYCHAGCPTDAVLESVGLRPRDLFNGGSGRNAAERNAARSPFVATYRYEQADGSVLMRVRRTADKEFPYQTRSHARGRWKNGGKDAIAIVPYRLPLILDALRAGSTVFVAEGEKDVDALVAAGLPATCNPFGALKWTDDITRALGQAPRVAILPDNDAAGRRHALEVAISIVRAGGSARIVNLGLEEPGADPADWLERGGRPGELLALARHATPLVASDLPRLEMLLENAIAEHKETLRRRRPARQGGGSSRSSASDASSQEQPRHGERTVILGDERWRAPEEDLDEQIATPPFPVDALPAWSRPFLEQLATFTQTPIELGASLFLSALATAIQPAANVEPRPGWVEPLGLFTLTILESGNRKSAALKEIVRPLIAFEIARNEELAPRIKERETTREILEKRIAHLSRKEAEAKQLDDLERAELRIARKEATEELASSPELRPVRLFASDFTIEALMGLMHDHDGCISIVDTEGGAFDKLAGIYSSGIPNFDAVLKAYSGDHIAYDRKTKGSFVVYDPRLTIGITAQVDILRALGERPSFRGRGLLARFLYSVPESMLGERDVWPAPIDESARRTYGRRMRRILELSTADREERATVRFTEEARADLWEFMRQVEPQLGPAGDWLGIRDWAAKLVGNTCRIAGLLLVADLVGHIEEPSLEHAAVDAETFARATAIAETYVEHALAAFGTIDARSGCKLESLILDMLRRSEEGIPKRRLLRSSRALKKIDDLDAPLGELAGRGCVRIVEVATGGRPRVVVELNPALRAG